ncbi:hypothetical protein POX_f07445 [Penicillium oxalicum]|uniref:hypothetical protein n=1 Tax=Penicillium oxalicum TaxID=69781 RepID=UPI0020B7FE82|nr:hypothetical protein POX_f07445 [Penicillium oxalicum]KAI2787088.1 hypothetical protein POX_f07445 [Penicillium oxalicum]
MTSASYRLDSFRPWNPFHDKPEALNMTAKLCRYPSPISMTATPTALSYDNPPKAQSYADKARRHPLPARPPEEVCLNAETKLRSQSTTLSEFGTSQRTVTVEHGDPTSYPEETVQTTEIEDTTAHIDPAILNDNPASSVEFASEASPCQELDLANTTDSSSPQDSTFDTVLPAPQLRQHTSGSSATLNKHTTSVTKRCYIRKRLIGNGSSRVLLRETSPRRREAHSPTFSAFRTQFFAMSLQDRLQFVSWLFESALSQCLSQPSSPGTKSLSNCGTSCDPSTKSGPMHQSSIAESVRSFDQSPYRELECGPQHHRESPLVEDKDQQDDDQLEYEIEEILAHKKGAHGSVSYLVKWKGYEESEATWEPGVSVRDTVALENYELQMAITADRTHATRDYNGSTGRAQGRNHSYSRRPDSVTKHTPMRHEPPTRKGLPWSPDEFALLSKLRVADNLPWSAIYREFSRKFPGRTKGSLQVYWSTKRREI